MFDTYVHTIAAELDVALTKVALVDNDNLREMNAYLLHLATRNHLVSTLIYRTDLIELQRSHSSDRLEVKIRSTLARLKTVTAAEPIPR